MSDLVLEAIGLRDVSVEHIEQIWDLEAPTAIIQAVLEGAVRARGLLLAQTEAARSAIEAAVKAGMQPHKATSGRFAVPMPAVVGAGVK